MGQSIRSNLQGPRSLLFMYSSAVVDHDCRTGHNLFPGKTADVSVSQLLHTRYVEEGLRMLCSASVSSGQHVGIVSASQSCLIVCG